MENSYYLAMDIPAVERDWNLPIEQWMEKAGKASLPSPEHYAVIDKTVLEKALLPELKIFGKKFGPNLTLAEICRREMESFIRADQRGENLLRMMAQTLLGGLKEPRELHDVARMADLYKGIVQLNRIGKAGRPCPFLISDDYFLDYCKEIFHLRGLSKLDGRIQRNQKRTLAPPEFLSVSEIIDTYYNFDARFNFPVELDPAGYATFWKKLDGMPEFWDRLAVREHWPEWADQKAFRSEFHLYRTWHFENLRIKDPAAKIETAIFNRKPYRLSIDDPGMRVMLREHLRDLGEIANFAMEKGLAFVKYYI